MKILYITNGINGAGGLERVLSIKASLLTENYGHEVYILVLNNHCDTPFYNFSSKLKLLSIDVSGNPLSYLNAYKRGIRDTVFKINPDIISVCDDGLKGFFVPVILPKRYKVVYERHVSKEIEITGKSSGINFFAAKAKWWLMDRLAANFSKFIVLTNGNLKEWPSLKNITVIPNPLSFFPAESSKLENRKVIAVGKHGYQKGFDRLLQAWALVEQKHPGWELSIYGTINSILGLKELSEKLQIQRTVSFYEPEKAIEKKYLESSIYVMSSRYEGFGMVLIEAMACGVPCVSFNCNYGPSDIIDDGVNGYLVPNGDIEALGSSICHLIDQTETRKLMGLQARQKAEQYKPEFILQKWDDLFKTLVYEDSF